ncbi:hypothetical protein DFH09DRAFT_1095504 [Mycena vulgaris]|nr:hypothetical protein DFH09DRAFT_1095504 [Mycena vulgaris]
MSNTMTVDAEDNNPSRDSSPLTELPSSSVTEVKTRDLEAPRPILPGMLGGYERSPMAELKKQFDAETEEDRSLSDRVGLMVKKRDLDPRDLRDRGISYSDTFPRFQLDTGVGMRLAMLVTDFQRVIQRAALLIPTRRPNQYFVIDPHAALMNVLLGADTMDEMTIAWHAMRRHFELGLEYLNKYDSEYKASTDRDVLVSPVSTAPELYDSLAGYDKAPSHHVARLTYLYENIPHLRETMPSEWQKEPTFPDRDPERRPSTIYYSQEGERKELEVPETSSWKASEEYAAPSGPWESRRKKTAKRVSIAPGESGKEERERRNTEWERDTTMRYPRVETATGSSISDRDERPGGSTTYFSAQPVQLYGSSTPFKTADQFLGTVPKSTEESASTHQVPNADLPDTLRGLAAPLSYGFGPSDSISQIRRQPKGPHSDYRYAGWSRQVPTHRAVLAESGLAKGDSMGSRRDRPPHMRESDGPSPPSGGQNREGSYFPSRQGSAPNPGEEGEVLQGAPHEIHLAETNLRRRTGAGEEGDMADLRMAATLRAAEGEQTREMLLTPLKLLMAQLYRRSILS